MTKEDFLQEGWIPLYGFENKILIKEGVNGFINLNYRNLGIVKECKASFYKNHYHITFSYNNVTRTIPLQRAIYESYHECSIPKNFDVHHIDKNPENNSLTNLQLLTKQQHYNLHGPNMGYEELYKQAVISYGKEEKEFGNVYEAEKETKINKNCIIQCCLGIRKRFAGGLYWKFKNPVKRKS